MQALVTDFEFADPIGLVMSLYDITFLMILTFVLGPPSHFVIFFIFFSGSFGVNLVASIRAAVANSSSMPAVANSSRLGSASLTHPLRPSLVTSCGQ